MLLFAVYRRGSQNALLAVPAGSPANG
jgi:hypothetical protein